MTAKKTAAKTTEVAAPAKTKGKATASAAADETKVKATAKAAGKPAEGRSFNDRNSRGPRVVGAGDRPERSGPGAGKVFVPRDMKKRPAKGARSDH